MPDKDPTTEIREMIDAAVVKHFGDTHKALNEVRGLLADDGRLAGLEGAVRQIETQLKAERLDLDEKLKHMRRSAFDDRGRYRGMFASEDDALCFGAFIHAAAGKDRRAADMLAGELKSVYERALGGTTELGEGLVPVEYSTRIDRLVEETSVFRRLAMNMPMSSDSLHYQRRVSGLTVYKTGRNVPATASDMGFATINLAAEEWNVLTLYPKSLAEDAMASIGEMIAREIAYSFAYQIDLCGLVGNGTATHLDVHGITTRLLAINGVDDGGGLVLGSGNLWSELTEDDFNELIGNVPQYGGLSPVFIASAPFYWQVMAKLLNAKGGVTRAEFAGSPGFQFQGFRAELTPVMPKTQANSQVCTLFGDLRLSSDYGSRKDLTIEQDTSVKFIERQVAVLGTQRHAIANHTLGTATAAGPVLGLITAAS